MAALLDRYNFFKPTNSYCTWIQRRRRWNWLTYRLQTRKLQDLLADYPVDVCAGIQPMFFIQDLIADYPVDVCAGTQPMFFYMD